MVRTVHSGTSMVILAEESTSTCGQEAAGPWDIIPGMDDAGSSSPRRSRRPVLLALGAAAVVALGAFAFVAWRASHPAARSTNRAMARAARTARARRTAAALAGGIGSVGGPA